MWNKVKLGEVLKHRNEFVQIDDLEKYKRCRVQLHRQGIVLRDIVLGSEIKTKKQQVCKTNDFLVAEMDAKVGGYGIVPETLEGSVVSSHYFLYELNTEKLLTNYLKYFTKTDGLQNQIVARGSTNYAAIRPKNVLEYEIPLPPLSEQIAIVEKLEKATTKLKQIKQLRAESLKETEMIFDLIIEQKIKQLSEQYKNKCFKEFCDVVRGGSPRPAGDPTFYGGKIPFLKVGDLTNDNCVYVQSFKETITELGLYKTRLVEKNTLLLTNSGATLGVPKITSFQTTFNDGIQAFINFKEEINLEYLYYFFKSKTKYFRDILARGAGQPNLNTDMVKNLPIPLPDLVIQKQTVKEFESIFDKVKALKQLQQQTEAEITAMEKSILNKYIQTN